MRYADSLDKNQDCCVILINVAKLTHNYFRTTLLFVVVTSARPSEL